MLKTYTEEEINKKHISKYIRKTNINYRRYSKEFKDKCIKKYLNRESSLSIAKNMKCGACSILRWVGKYRGKEFIRGKPRKEMFCTELSLKDRAWLSGFFDAEGSVSISVSKNLKNPSHFLRISLSNTNHSIMLWINEKLGGYLCFRKKKNNRRDIEWRVSSNNAERFLNIIYPYSIIKKEQIKLALEFQDTKKNNIDKALNKVLDVEEIRIRDSYREKISNLSHEYPHISHKNELIKINNEIKLDNLSTEQKSYLAGYTDGDGYIGIMRQRNKAGAHYTLCVRLGTFNKLICEWIINNIGGSLYCSKVKNNHKYCIHWDAISNNAQKFLESIGGFLKIKKKHVELAIEFQKNKQKYFRVRNILEERNKILYPFYQQMKKLNARGVRNNELLEDL